MILLIDLMRTSSIEHNGKVVCRRQQCYSKPRKHAEFLVMHFGYIVNESKSQLFVKDCEKNLACEIFSRTGVEIVDGCRVSGPLVTLLALSKQMSLEKTR